MASSKIMNLLNTNIYNEVFDTLENIKNIEGYIKYNYPILKVPVAYESALKDLNKSFIELHKAETNFKEILEQTFPKIDADKFIDLSIKQPLYKGIIDINFYDKILDQLVENYQVSNSDLVSSIEVTSSDSQNENVVIITPEEHKTLIQKFSLVLRDVLLAVSVNIAMSDTQEIKNHIDVNLEETRIHIDSPLEEQLQYIKGISVKQNTNIEEIQLKLNQILENQEQILKKLDKEDEK